jgi:hypothetical protein
MCEKEGWLVHFVSGWVSEWVSERAIEKVDWRDESELLCEKLNVFQVIMDFFTVYGLRNITFLFIK